MRGEFNIRITFVQVMRNSISPVPWFYCSPILRMAAVACSHSLSKRLKLTLLQQGGMLRTPDLVELRNLTLLQQGGTSPTFEVVYLTLLQQGDPVFSTGTGEAMIFTLLQQGGRPKAHGAGECLDLTLLQQGAESRFSQSCDPMAQKHTNR
jgi:hypothetical protein